VKNSNSNEKNTDQISDRKNS